MTDIFAKLTHKMNLILPLKKFHYLLSALLCLLYGLKSDYLSHERFVVLVQYFLHHLTIIFLEH